MSDYVPDPKVEDVLSSVRRLVSQEIPRRRPMSRGAPGSVGVPGALVLGPTDRVEREFSSRVHARTLQQKVVELEAAVSKSDAEFEPDGSEDQLMHRPDRIVYTRPRPSEETAGRTRSRLRLSEIALIDTGFEDDEAEAGTPDEPREAPMLLDAPILPPVSAEVRAFSNPDDVVERIEARIERGPDAAPPAAAPAIRRSSAEQDRSDAVLSATVRATIAESARLDGSSVPTQAAGPVAPQPQAKAPDPVAGARAALDAIPDEDALRLLVSRLIREELQGDLGERITSIVRKLVRSEVRRVVDLQELD